MKSQKCRAGYIPGDHQTRKRTTTTEIIKPGGSDNDEEDNQANGMEETPENVLISNEYDEKDSHKVPETLLMVAATPMVTPRQMLLPKRDV